MNDNDVRILTEVEQRAKSNSHQIEEIKEDVKEIKAENKAIYELTTSVKLIAQDMGSIKADLAEVKQGQKELTQDVSEVKSRPAQKTADTVDKVRVAIITAICTMIATGIVGSLIVYVK